MGDKFLAASSPHRYSRCRCHVAAGCGLTVVESEVGRLGVGICYDLRFPEMAALYAARGVQLIVYPGGVGWTEGQAGGGRLGLLRHRSACLLD